MAQLPPGVDPTKTPLYSPPQGQTSNFIDPPSLAPVVEGVGGLLIAIETILVVLRTCSNFKTFGKLRFEDFWIIFATILTYGYFAILMLYKPIMRHIWDIPSSRLGDSTLKVLFAEEIVIGPSLFFAKASLLLLFYRIFSSDKHFRYKIYGAFTFIAMTTLTGIPVYSAVCFPRTGDSWAEAAVICKVKMIPYGLVQGSASVAFDLFILYLPASIVVGLNMPRRRKIGVLAIFATGMLAVVASIVGLAYRINLGHNDDGTWANAICELCIHIECCVSIICSCMPTIPAIVKMIAENRFIVMLRSRLHSHHGSSKPSQPLQGPPVEAPPRKKFSKYGPYMELIYSASLSTPSTKTMHAQRVAQPEQQDIWGINMSVHSEVSSTTERLSNQHENPTEW